MRANHEDIAERMMRCVTLADLGDRRGERRGWSAVEGMDNVSGGRDGMATHTADTVPQLARQLAILVCSSTLRFFSSLFLSSFIHSFYHLIFVHTFEE